MRPVVAIEICSGSRANRSAALADSVRSTRIALERIRFIRPPLYSPSPRDQSLGCRFNKSLRVRQPSTRFTRDAKYRPLIHRDSSKFLVELNRRLVPVEDSPFESAAVPFACDSRQFSQHGPTKSIAAHFRNDEQIFKVKARPAKKRRKVVKKNRKGDGLVVSIAQKNFCVPSRTKKTVPQRFFGDHRLMGETFVLGQLTNK